MRRMHFCALFFRTFFELFRLFVVCFPPVGHAGSEAHFHFDWSLSFARAFSRQQGDDRILATEKNFTFTRGSPDDSLTFFLRLQGKITVTSAVGSLKFLFSGSGEGLRPPTYRPDPTTTGLEAASRQERERETFC